MCPRNECKPIENTLAYCEPHEQRLRNGTLIPTHMGCKDCQWRPPCTQGREPSALREKYSQWNGRHEGRNEQRSKRSSAGSVNWGKTNTAKFILEEECHREPEHGDAEAKHNCRKNARGYLQGGHSALTFEFTGRRRRSGGMKG